MQPYPDPLAAGDPPALGNALEPLPGYAEPAAYFGDSFGDALAAGPAGADPTSAPLSALNSSVFAGDFGRADFAGDFGRTDFGRTGFGRTGFGRTGFGRTDFAADFGRTDFAGDFGRTDFADIAGANGAVAASPVRVPEAAGAERPAESPETTTMGLEIPAAGRQVPGRRAPVEGGRYELGIPRGYDPPSVPANRGWASPAAAAAPRERRGRGRPTPQPQARRTGGRPQARRGMTLASGAWQEGAQSVPWQRGQPTQQPRGGPQGGAQRPGARATAPRLGTPAPARQPRNAQPAAVREIPPEYAQLIKQRAEATKAPSSLFWAKFSIAIVLALVAFGEGINHNWAATAVFAGLVLIVVRPKPRPERVAAAQAAAERRRRANAAQWPPRR